MKSGNSVFAWSLVVLTGSWLTAAPAAADNKGKAKVMISQTRGALSDDNCFQSTGCGDRATVPAAVTKCEQALALDPTPETALKICDMLKDVRGPDLKWAVESGALHVALSHCDYAAFHPDSSEELRRRARDTGHMARMYIAEARTKPENDARRAAAAKALYGVGLAMKYDKKKNEISLDYGSLDAKTLQSYIGEYYTEFAMQVGNNNDRVAIQYLANEQKNAFWAGRETGHMGWLLLEPMAKYSLCRHIAWSMKQGIDELDAWCKVQAVIEANAPLFAFTGTPVTWNAGDLKGGGLTPDQAIYLPAIDGNYPVAITIAGPNPINDYQHIHFIKAAAYQLKSDDPQVLGMVAKAEKVAKAREAKWAKADAKLGGKKGKVVFSEQTFESWDLPKLVTGTGDCTTLHYKAYAPKGSKSYDLSVAIDGTTCDVFSVWSTGQSSGVTGLLNSGDCSKVLLIPGNHEITTTMHEVKAAKTGNRVIKAHGSGLKIEDEYMGVWGKKVGTWKAKCTTAGKPATSRFE